MTVPAVSRKLHVKLLENYDSASNSPKPRPTTSAKAAAAGGSSATASAIIMSATPSGACNRRPGPGAADRLLPSPAPEADRRFSERCEKVLVVEEGEPYHGGSRQSPGPGRRADPAHLRQGAGPVLPALRVRPGSGQDQAWPPISVCLTTPPAVPDLSDLPEIPQRPPTLCAGCSHRATFYAVKKAAEGLDTIYPTDIGCYTLGFCRRCPWAIF